ncbi:RluA family pseudouridine synthase [Candidatus Tremblaya phenacola]|uniref:RluA family pseudouridine synthase n=1 Tax=Candidatus Tremblayella phenacoccinincola TaxID=1010676 RepID=UPI001330C002|nr:RluA family pseudouridine synthase [Candidatus Tremblaya phenacola]KAH0998189.1 LSU rRNA pseudouridine(1911/1915/1917) synthase [Candidatus Tremblaya phenacola]
MNMLEPNNVRYVGLLNKTCRLDVILVSLFPAYSRSFFKKVIIFGRVKVNEQLVLTPKKRLFGLELIEVRFLYRSSFSIYPQRIALDIIYEDVYIIVLNKASGFILHPGFGNSEYTIFNGLLYYYPPNTIIPRAGIVHRLDKDTTGLLIIAKSISIYIKLVEVFRLKKLIREYEGVAFGSLSFSGKIVKPILRNPVKRVCMKADNRGKSSITNYFVKERFPFHTRLRFNLETGRTHQIRIHMVYVKHPFVGDKQYGKVLYNSSSYLYNKLKEPKRQVLHAIKLEVLHPVTFVKMKLESPLTYDILSLLNVLRGTDSLTGGKPSD